MKSIQSPLFVSTDSDSDSEGIDGDEFDSDAYDNDNDSIDSAALTPTEIEQETLSRRNTQIHLDLPNSPRSLKFRSLGKQEERYSSTDPFAANYRKTADWDEETKALWQREWGFVTDFIEKYESVEHAEFTRPFDQFRVLIQVSLNSPPIGNGDAGFLELNADLVTGTWSSPEVREPVRYITRCCDTVV